MRACAHCGEDNPDRARFCLACGSALPAERPDRRPVTALVCDLVGSTRLAERLDAEVLRRVLDRYHETMRAAIERHGGTVEKFIGDAVVGIFGVPSVHEDDALRAVRAALDMCDGVPSLRAELGLEFDLRIGIQTGEAVADAASAVSGRVGADALNTAARLQAAADPGGVLVGDATADLVAASVALEPTGPLLLRGKELPVAAFAVAGLRRRQAAGDGPLVGRRRDLDVLLEAVEDAGASNAPVLVTILAPPGVGKSRLGRAFAGAVGDRASVLVAQTPSYGEGVTFAPLVELMAQSVGGVPHDTAGVATALRERLLGEPDGEIVAERLAHLLGVGASTPGDTTWAVRRLLETLAADRPVVAILDDLHWAEEPMLDVVESTVDRVHAPLVIVCLARPELLEVRPTWGGGRRQVITRTLLPLTRDEARALARQLLGADAPEALVHAVVERSEGNPLFAEQLVATLRDRGLLIDGRWAGDRDADLAIPPTIQALLAARLDTLEPAARSALGVAAVEGRRFTVDNVAALAGTEEHDIRAALEPLEGRAFVEPEDRAGTRWRFAHVLVREAVYARVPKEQRAALHEALAARLAVDAAGAGDDETIARHLQLAVAFRRELLLNDDHTAELARRAGERFAAAGERAYAALDLSAAASLLERAVGLLPSDAIDRFRILPPLGVALMEVGRPHDAEALLADASEEASAHGAEAEGLRAEVQLVVARAVYEATTDTEIDAHLAALGRLRESLESFGDEAGLAEAWIAVEYLEFMRGHAGRMYDADRRAVDYALAAGRSREAIQASGDLLFSAVLGPMAFDEIRAAGMDLARANDPIRRSTGLAAIVASDIAERSDRYVRDERAWVDEVERNGLAWLGAVHGVSLGVVDLAAGTFERLERRLSDARLTLTAMGDVWWLNTIDPLLAHAIDGQGRMQEFLRLADQYETRVAMFDRDARIRRHVLRAVASLRRGALDESEASARTAFELVGPTDLLATHAFVRAALAQVLDARGFVKEALEQRDAAIELHRTKGNLAGIRALTSLRAVTSGGGDES
jgi:class 3 adenylate cyclase/tetratricopeptide (TPR) repeat protein